MAADAWGQQTLLSVEGRASYLLPHTEKVEERVRIKSDMMFGASLMYGYPDRAVEFSIEQVAMDLNDGTTDGRLVMVPILISGYRRWVAPDRRWIPFFGMGIGLFANQFKSSQETDQDIDDTIGLQVLTGLEYSIWKKLSIVLEARYLFAKADVRTRVTEGGEVVESRDKINLSTVVTGLGIKQYF
jgi:outer membrane protein W